MEIKKLDVTRLRVTESFGFFKKVEELTGLLTLESDKAMVDSYVQSVSEFDNVLKQSVKNSQTESVAKADEEVDALWTSFKAHAKALRKYPDAQKAQIAQKTYAIFEKFGDATRKGYTQEYGVLFNMLQELEAIPQEEQEGILTALYTTELRAKYEAFMSAQSAQTKEGAEYQKGAIAKHFDSTTDSYGALVKRVNALILINGENDYKDFVSQMNVIIDHEIKNLASR